MKIVHWIIQRLVSATGLIPPPGPTPRVRQVTLPDGAPARKPGQSDREWLDDLFAFYFKENMKPVVADAKRRLAEMPPDVASNVAAQLEGVAHRAAAQGREKAHRLVDGRSS